jgi:hypothetical protein
MKLMMSRTTVVRMKIMGALMVMSMTMGMELMMVMWRAKWWLLVIQRGLSLM